MKNLLYILILFLFSCKSTSEVKKNKLDITTVKTADIQNVVNLSTINFAENEIIIYTADPKQPTIITDKNGNRQKFENVKKVTIKKKTEQKKDSVVKENKTFSEKVIDKSKINVIAKSVSDTKDFKGITLYVALSLFFILVIYLVYKFKK